MAGNPTPTVSLGFTICLVALFLSTYFPVLSNAFILRKSRTMIHTTKNGQQEENGLSAGWEPMEEIFVASSTGEGMEVIDMVEHEDSEQLRNSAVKNVPLNLALSLITVSLVLFFSCVA